MRATLLLLAALSLFINILSPRQPLAPQESDTLLSALKNQPVLQCYFLLSSIPVAIVNKLLCPDAPAAARQAPAPRREVPAGRSSAEFMITTASCQDQFRSSFIFPVMESAVRAFRLSAPACAGATESSPGALLLFLLLLLLLLSVLPRGSLDDKIFALLFILTRRAPTERRSPAGFFIDGGRPCI